MSFLSVTHIVFISTGSDNVSNAPPCAKISQNQKNCYKDNIEGAAALVARQATGNEVPTRKLPTEAIRTIRSVDILTGTQ